MGFSRQLNTLYNLAIEISDLKFHKLLWQCVFVDTCKVIFSLIFTVTDQQGLVSNQIHYNKSIWSKFSVHLFIDCYL